jgi:hypothetical protein
MCDAPRKKKPLEQLDREEEIRKDQIRGRRVDNLTRELGEEMEEQLWLLEESPLGIAIGQFADLRGAGLKGADLVTVALLHVANVAESIRGDLALLIDAVRGR